MTGSPARRPVAVLASTAAIALIAGSMAGAAQAQTASANNPLPAPTTPSAGQRTGEGEVVGIVRDASGRFVNGAEVELDSSNIVARTDSEGRFRIQNVQPGSHTVTASYFGLEPRMLNVDVQPGSVTQVTIDLQAQVSGDTIVVSGARPIAESEAAALQLQRSSTSLISAVAADSIGRFPDQNIAAALSRLPGIAVQRDQGQERFVSLRGAQTSWTTISFDGINVISPAGRTTRFDTIPSSIASAVIVRKAVTPNMPGETVAGNIDVRTRAAFDYPGLKAAGDVAYGFNDLGGGHQYNVGGYISDRLFNDTIGILVSASRYERDMVTDNFEGGWTVRNGEVWSNQTQNKLYRLTRSNTAFSGRLDWRPWEGHNFFLSSIHTEFRDDELRNQYVFDLDERTNGPGYADPATGNTPYQGTIYGVEIDSSLNSNSSRQRIFTNTLGGDHALSDWDISWRLNYTRAQDEGRPPFGSSWASPTDQAARPTVVYDLTDPDLSKVRLYETVVNPDGSYSMGAERPFISTNELAYRTMTRTRRLDETDAYTARLDFTRQLDLLGSDTTLQFGGQYDDRTKEADRTVLEARAADLEAAGIALPTQEAFAITDPYRGDMPMGYSFRYFSSDAGEALFDSFIEQGGTRVQPGARELNYYQVNEQVFAAYLMGTTYFDWGNIVAGSRIEHVKNASEAFVQTTVDDEDVFNLAEISSDMTLVFPSLHINWDVNDDMKLRLSFNTGAARPDYPDLRPNLTFNDLEQTVSGGNPLAKPEKAKGVDLYYEWYMPSRGFLSVGAYYKDVTDVLFDVELPQFGITDFDTPELPRSTYIYTTIDNGASGSIKGLEFAFSQPLEGLVRSAGLPDWLGGFGVQANLTLNESEAETPDGRSVPLPGASDMIYNVSGYYERAGFSARVSWQYRTEWINSLGSNPLLGDNYWGDVGRLDVSARYAINDNVELYFDANNLLNEPGVRYVGIPSRVVEHETFGARYLWGARVNF